MVFSVKACNDAHLAMAESEAKPNELAYTIQIGNYKNTKSVIRTSKKPGSENKALALTPNILNCDEFRTFWVSWRNGRIQVGRGSVPKQRQFMEWEDPRPLPVNFFSVSSGYGSTGEWRIGLTPGTHAHGITCP